MKLDVQRLDERIKKLQEIRRIAADPEMLSILLEFILPDNEHAPMPQPAGNTAQTQHDDVEGLIEDELLKGVAGAPQSSAGIWGARRG
jgi:hypothetical protein